MHHLELLKPDILLWKTAVLTALMFILATQEKYNTPKNPAVTRVYKEEIR